MAACHSTWNRLSQQVCWYSLINIPQPPTALPSGSTFLSFWSQHGHLIWFGLWHMDICGLWLESRVTHQDWGQCQEDSSHISLKPLIPIPGVCSWPSWHNGFTIYKEEYVPQKDEKMKTRKDVLASFDGKIHHKPPIVGAVWWWERKSESGKEPGSAS